MVIAPFDTTANITWQTPAPSPTQIEYGASTSYGLSLSNPAASKNHVVTLKGTVGSAEAKARAATIAGGTEGVGHVVDDVIVVKAK